MTTQNDMSKANTTFSLNLFKELADKGMNVFFSPFSISSALAMVMLGAKGNTAVQMSEVLGFIEPDNPKPEEEAKLEEEAKPEEETKPEEEAKPDEEPKLEQEAQPPSMQTPMRSLYQSQMQTRRQFQMQMRHTSKLPQYLLKCLKPQSGEGDVHAGFEKLLSEFNKADALYDLYIANRLYGEKSYQFLEHFLDETKKHYSAGLEPTDFSGNPEDAVVKINSWVEEQTQGKIEELILKGVVDAATKLVLVNAIYFKGKWDKQFKEEDTTDAQFRINKNDSKPVKMMRQKSKFSFTYIPELNFQILELPYEGKELSMIIMLPNEIEDDTTGLEKLEKALTYKNFVEWTGQDTLGQSEVTVSLPRFKMAERYKLKEVLISMGMKDAFDVEMSDFSGMTPSNDLVLSKVVHQAVVDVNEEGTEAAAATAAVMTERSAPITEDFNADHPFLFFIRHNPSKSILFAGRYCSPE